jgi:hypothetical protein
MLTTHFVELIERLDGRKWVTQVASQKGAPTERTLRNWQSGATAPSDGQLSRLSTVGREAVRTKLIKEGVGVEKATAHADGLADEPGLMSAVVRDLSVDVNTYSRTLDLARQVDRLSNDLLVMRRSEKLADARQVILECQWFTSDHWHLNLPGAECPVDMRKLMEQAEDWPAMVLPFNVLTINVLLQFLATLDLEFRTSYAPSFEATPTFTYLHPTLPGDGLLKPDKVTGRHRNLVHRPIRRLIDLLACMRECKLKRRWPDRLPKVQDIANWMSVKESELTKWRLGRSITVVQFSGAWNAMFKRFEPDQRPSAPWPLLVAAHLLTILYVRGNREKQEEVTVLIPDGSDYLRWWERQKGALSIDEKGLCFGTAPWSMPLN